MGAEWVQGDDDSNFMRYGINSEIDIVKMDLVSFIPHLITQYDFPCMDMAYIFYCHYAKDNGFSVLKGRVLSSKRTSEELQQDFWCSNNGYRIDKGLRKYGGYEKVGFRIKDMYNQIERQRKNEGSDAMSALEFLNHLASKDEMMYFDHTVDWGRGCMLGEYDVGQFREKWLEMVERFGLEEHPWVRKMYDTMSKWATTYFRDNFFAGFKTTSGCESLHVELGRRVVLLELYTELSEVYCDTYEEFSDAREKIIKELHDVKAKKAFERASVSSSGLTNDVVRDPVRKKPRAWVMYPHL
ncbi:FAR1 DNA-binding domain [Sesbania bispinosa]|nr:FAR1 DNA-binding domain [Sesbania bispinosa]